MITKQVLEGKRGNMFKKIVDREEGRPQQDGDDDGDEKGKKLLLSLKHTYLFFFFLLAGGLKNAKQDTFTKASRLRINQSIKTKTGHSTTVGSSLGHLFFCGERVPMFTAFEKLTRKARRSWGPSGRGPNSWYNGMRTWLWEGCLARKMDGIRMALGLNNEFKRMREWSIADWFEWIGLAGQSSKDVCRIKNRVLVCHDVVCVL